jgi:hypothetical protein
VTKYVYTQSLSLAQREAIKINNLSTNQVARYRLIDAAGVKSAQEGGVMHLEGVCPINPAHKAPKRHPRLHPVTVPADIFYFKCVGAPDGAGAHPVTVEEWIKAMYPKVQDRRKFLEKILICHAELVRVHAFEHDDQSGVALQPNDALGEMNLEDTDTVRGVLLEVVDLAVGKQLVGQLHDKLPWREDVRLNDDNTLADVAWHNHWLTNHEQILLREQEQREQRAKHEQYRKEVEEFKNLRAQELGL